MDLGQARVPHQAVHGDLCVVIEAESGTILHPIPATHIAPGRRIERASVAAMLIADATIRIHRIRPDDGPVLRDLRLRSLAESPEAFGQQADDAAAQSDAEWASAARVASQGERRAWFIAETVGDPGGLPRTLGLVLGRRRPPDTLMVFSMWVDPAVRRAGLGARLIEAAEAWAVAWGGRSSVLWVFAGNEPAVRFYDRIGFTILASGEDARTGAVYGALAMSRPIGPASVG